ncbi:hypothetical protein [Anaerospora hongkongensis]|uniref:hypothetical protein n=1 Tax=Anaerospora hongkongensis TaxID=244830 RepID=UPI0010537C24|nr:hypothetical protein [Anaerospora hongkongensis]
MKGGVVFFTERNRSQQPHKGVGEGVAKNRQHYYGRMLFICHALHALARVQEECEFPEQSISIIAQQ